MSGILNVEVGAHVGIIAGRAVEFGVIESLSPNQIVVKQAGGVLRKFSRASLFEIGHKGTRYERPALVAHGQAVQRKRDYDEATRLAGIRLRQMGVMA